MPSKKNILPNGDHQLYTWWKGKFIVTDPTDGPIGPKERGNFLITCEYGDWSGFLTFDELQGKMKMLERDKSEKSNFFFKAVERL